MIGLSLDGEGIFLHTVATRVAKEVGILVAVGIGGLHNHGLLAIGVGNIVKHGGKVLKSSVPCGIVGGSENVVVNAVRGEIVAVILVIRNLLGVSKMNCNKGAGANLTGSLTACLHKSGNVCPALEAAEIAVCLVTDLHHTDINACRNKLFKAFLGVIVESLGHCGRIHALPCLGSHLLCRVGPEVGVMEVDQQLHAVLCGTLADLNSVVNITVTAAVAVAVLIIGIVPDSDTDVIYAVVGKDLIDVLLTAVKIIVFHTAFFKRGDAGGIHTHDKALGKVVNLSYVEAVGGNAKRIFINGGKICVVVAFVAFVIFISADHVILTPAGSEERKCGSENKCKANNLMCFLHV